MLREIILIVVGLVTIAILAFASHDSQSQAVRILFWISLFAAGGIIVISGISGIRTGSNLKFMRNSLSEATNNVHELEQEIERYKPFRISEQDKAMLYRTARELVAKETTVRSTPPSLHLLTFPGQSADAAEFQEILKNAFEQAGKKTTPHHNLGITGTHIDGTPWDGVIVQVNNLEHPPLLGQGIFALLQRLGINVWSKEGSGLGTNAVVIYSHRPSYIQKEPDETKKSNQSLKATGEPAP